VSRAARSYDNLLRELADDERAELRGQGRIPPHRDGSPALVVEGCHAGLTDYPAMRGHYRAHCSCGYVGGWRAEYVDALADSRAHRGSCS
jgi:hypothetical protein